MTYEEAISATLLFAAAFAFASWYLQCWFVMLFCCQSLRSYFSSAYPSSALFLGVNGAALVLVAAWFLHKFTT